MKLAESYRISTEKRIKELSRFPSSEVESAYKTFLLKIDNKVQNGQSTLDFPLESLKNYNINEDYLFALLREDGFNVAIAHSMHAGKSLRIKW